MALKIINLFANKDEACGYGDIYADAAECLAEHPNDDIIVGFGVLDTETGFVTDGSDDLYFTEEDAQEYIDLHG